MHIYACTLYVYVLMASWAALPLMHTCCVTCAPCRHIVGKYNVSDADVAKLLKWKHTHY